MYKETRKRSAEISSRVEQGGSKKRLQDELEKESNTKKSSEENGKFNVWEEERRAVMREPNLEALPGGIVQQNDTSAGSLGIEDIGQIHCEEFDGQEGANWEEIHSIDQLKQCPCFCVMPSKIAPKKTNKSGQKPKYVISGSEIILRVAGPEKMSASLLGDYLQLGHSKEDPKGKGHTRVNLARIIDLIRPPNDGSSGKKRGRRLPHHPVYTAFSLLLEGDVRSMAQSLQEEAARCISQLWVQEEIIQKVPGDTIKAKLNAIQTTREVMAKTLESLKKFPDFETRTHGGMHFVEAVWNIVDDMLPKQNFMDHNYVIVKNIDCEAIKEDQ